MASYDGSGNDDEVFPPVVDGYDPHVYPGGVTEEEAQFPEDVPEEHEEGEHEEEEGREEAQEEGEQTNTGESWEQVNGEDSAPSAGEAFDPWRDG